MNSAPLLSATVTETRGQSAKRRRAQLGIARERVAREAGVSVRTVKYYEEDARQNMPSGPRIEAALERLEATSGSLPTRRRTDNQKRRTLEAMIEQGEGETVRAYVLDDGTRAIFVVPEGGRVPTPDEIERAIRLARGE